MITALVRITAAGLVATGAGFAGIAERCPNWSQSAANFGWSASSNAPEILMTCIVGTAADEGDLFGQQLRAGACPSNPAAAATTITISLTAPGGSVTAATCSGPGTVTCAISATCEPGTWRVNWHGIVTRTGFGTVPFTDQQPDTTAIQRCP